MSVLDRIRSRSDAGRQVVDEDALFVERIPFARFVAHTETVRPPRLVFKANGGHDALPDCPHCGDDDVGLMPPDFETVKCDGCGRNFARAEWPASLKGPPKIVLKGRVREFWRRLRMRFVHVHEHQRQQPPPRPQPHDVDTGVTDPWSQVERMEPVEIRPGHLAEIHDLKALRLAAEEDYRARLLWDDAHPDPKKEFSTRDGKKVRFPFNSFKEIRKHSADRRIMEVVPSLEALMGNAIPILSEPDRYGRPRITTWHTYAARARLHGRLVYVKLVTWEEAGKLYLSFRDTNFLAGPEITKALGNAAYLLTNQERHHRGPEKSVIPARAPVKRLILKAAGDIKRGRNVLGTDKLGRLHWRQLDLFETPVPNLGPSSIKLVTQPAVPPDEPVLILPAVPFRGRAIPPPPATIETAPIHTTPRTRLKWSTLGEWIEVAETLHERFMRHVSAGGYERHRQHVAALDRNTINREADPTVVRQAIELLNSPDMLRGAYRVHGRRSNDDPMVVRRNWLQNRLQQLAPAVQAPRQVDVVHRWANPENGTEVLIVHGKDGAFRVVLRDTDADQTVGGIRIYPTEQAAIAYALHVGAFAVPTVQEIDDLAGPGSAIGRNTLLLLAGHSKTTPGNEWMVERERQRLTQEIDTIDTMIREFEEKLPAYDELPYWRRYLDLLRRVAALPADLAIDQSLAKASLFRRLVLKATQLGLFGGSHRQASAPRHDVLRPGSRGGRYRVDRHGHIRYDGAATDRPSSAGVLPLLAWRPKQPAAPAPLPDLKTATKLRRVADAMSESIAYNYNPAIAHQNVTRRRSGIAAGMAQEAERLEELQCVTYALAQMHEDGTVPEVLRNVRTRTQIKELLQARWRHGKPAIGPETYPQPMVRTRDALDVLRLARSLQIPGSSMPVHDRNDFVAASPEEWEQLGKVARRIVDARREGRIPKKITIEGTAYQYQGATWEWSEHLVWSAQRIVEAVAGLNRVAALKLTPEQWGQAQAEIRKLRKEKAVDPVARTIQQKERDLIGRKIPGYFPTPAALAERLVDLADIRAGMSVLEPSAGKGSIAAAVSARHPDNELWLIEHESSLASILQLKGYPVLDPNLSGGVPTGSKGALQIADFMAMWPDGMPHRHFDRILMNPPFEHGQDVEHVRHAFELLAPGGRLVSIMGAHAFFASDGRSQAFREWLDDLGATTEKLPEKSFMSSERPTGVQTYLVVIDKAAAAMAKADVQAPGSRGGRFRMTATGRVSYGWQVSRCKQCGTHAIGRGGPGPGKFSRCPGCFGVLELQAGGAHFLREQNAIDYVPPPAPMAKALAEREAIAKDLFYLVEEDLPAAAPELAPALQLRRQRLQARRAELDAAIRGAA